MPTPFLILLPLEEGEGYIEGGRKNILFEF